MVLQLIRGVMCLLGDPFDVLDSYTIDNEAIEIILIHEMDLFLIKRCNAKLAYFVIVYSNYEKIALELTLYYCY